MKRQTAVLIGLGVLVAAGIPTVASVLAIQNMQAEVQSAQVLAQTATEEKEAAVLQAQKDAETQTKATEARDLARQEEIIREVAEERAQAALEDNTEIAWDQFIGVVQASTALAEQEGMTLEQLSQKVVSSIDAIPLSNVDPQATSAIQSVSSVFKDARQHMVDYNAEVKALADRTPGAAFSAGVDGCSLVTDTLDADNSFWNAVGCASGLLAGAGISSASAEASANQLDAEHEANMNAIFIRFDEIDQLLDSTAEYLDIEYDIQTPEELLN